VQAGRMPILFLFNKYTVTPLSPPSKNRK